LQTGPSNWTTLTQLLPSDNCGERRAVISAEDFFDILTRVTLALVALLALVDFLRHRERVRLDVVLMLASLGIPVLVQFLPDSIGERRWVSAFTGMAIVAQPYLLLRLVEDFRRVFQPYVWVAIAGMVFSWVALIVFPEPPPVVALAIIVYFEVVEGYAAFAFLRGTTATGGPTRWRLGFAAAGSLLLAVIIFLAGVEILAPRVEGVVDRGIPFLPVLAGICYYLGFVPPGWLRRAWQLPELHHFLQAMAGASPAERSSRTAQELCRVGSRVGGGLVVCHS
jgi:hypothetical protein